MTISSTIFLTIKLNKKPSKTLSEKLSEKSAGKLSDEYQKIVGDIFWEIVRPEIFGPKFGRTGEGWVHKDKHEANKRLAGRLI